MKKTIDWLGKRQHLRADADLTFSSLAPPETGAQPAEVVLHELLVHKFELEMQIEELRRTHTELEEARDRYVEYYEFAPIGYLTVSTDCVIDEVNLTGAALLGVDRSALIKRRLDDFVAPPDRGRWHRLFMGMMKHADIETRTFVLDMARADGTRFNAYLHCRRQDATDARSALRVALFDIGRIHQAEAEKDGVRAPDLPPPGQ